MVPPEANAEGESVSPASGHSARLVKTSPEARRNRLLQPHRDSSIATGWRAGLLKRYGGEPDPLAPSAKNARLALGFSRPPATLHFTFSNSRRMVRPASLGDGGAGSSTSWGGRLVVSDANG